MSLKNLHLESLLPAKGGLKKMFGLKNIKIAGEAASADQNAAQEFTNTFKNITVEKGYLPEQVFNPDESALFWQKLPARTFVSNEEK